MRSAMLWRDTIGVDGGIIESIDVVGGVIEVQVRPKAKEARRCGVCQKQRRGYDQGEGRRRWRHMDSPSGRQVVLIAAAPRVSCPQHGVVVAAVPWARHDAGHTFTFDRFAAFLATTTSKSAVAKLLRTSWRTIGKIVERLWDDLDDPEARLGGLRRIGIDEISYKRNHKYVTVVVNHDTGRVIYVGEDRTRDSVRAFFQLLGPERCAQITHVSADGAGWIAEVVDEYCENAIRATDPFHVVQWLNKALGKVRIDAWNEARKEAKLEPPRSTGWYGREQERPARDLVKKLKGSRFALWKNPENLTPRQQSKLDWIQASDKRLWRAYQGKERLRAIFQMDYADARVALDKWIAWARRCRIDHFVELQRRIVRHRVTILNAVKHGLNNGLAESTNSHIRVLTKLAYGFHSAHALIAIIMLTRSGVKLEPR